MIGIGLGALVARWIYRPLIWSHDVNDLGLAGALPNFFAVLLFTVGLAHWWVPRHAAVGSTVVAVLYEFQQQGSPVRTFDPLDIVASVVGGVLGYLLLCTYARDGGTESDTFFPLRPAKRKESV